MFKYVNIFKLYSPNQKVSSTEEIGKTRNFKYAVEYDGQR